MIICFTVLVLSGSVSSILLATDIADGELNVTGANWATTITENVISFTRPGYNYIQTVDSTATLCFSIAGYGDQRKLLIANDVSSFYTPLSIVSNVDSEKGLDITNSVGHARITMQSPSGKQNMLRFFNESDCKWKFYHDTNDDKFIFQYYPVGSRVENLVLLPTGGIEINGGVKSSGTVKALNYACSSDQRFKENIAPLNNSLAKVYQLKGVSYNWKKDYKGKTFDGSKDLGFIAQDVEKIYPELVYTDKEGYKSMNYQKFTAVLVEALKEAKNDSNAKIDASNQKIAALEKENKDLKLKVASLEQLNNRIAKLEKILENADAVALK